MGLRMVAGKRWRDFPDAWVDYNGGIQRSASGSTAGLAITGVKPEDVPSDVEVAPLEGTLSEAAPSAAQGVAFG